MSSRNRAATAADRAAALSDELAAHEARTGNQVALLTLPSLEGEPLEEFTHRVASTWKLGRKGTDNGVLALWTEATEPRPTVRLHHLTWQ